MTAHDRPGPPIPVNAKLPSAVRSAEPQTPAGPASWVTVLRVWWPAVALGLYTLAIDAWVAARWDGSRASMTALAAWGPIPAVASAVAAVAWLLLRGRLAGLRQRAWQALCGSLCFILVGSAIWAYQVAVGTDDVGGLGDLVYWVSFPFVALAMALFFLEVGGSFRQPIVWLDVATLTIAVGVAMWEFVVRPTLAVTAAEPGAALAATVYAASFVLATVFAGLAYMQVADWKAERALVLLVGAAFANVLAECFSGGETPSTLAATLAYTTAYLAADLMVVAAAIAESRRDPAVARLPPRSESATSALPALSILLAVTTLIILHGKPQGADTWVTVGVALLGALLVSGREISTRYDVHRQYRARALAEAEARLTELIRRSRDVVAVVGADGRLAYVSPAAGAVLGLQPEALAGQPASALVGAANASRMTAYLDSLARGSNAEADIDFEVTLASGERRIVAVVGSDERASAVIGGIALTLSDATRERRAERALIDDAARERQALSSEAHEGIAQELAGIALLVQSLRGHVATKDTDAAGAVRMILDELSHTIGGVRRLAAALSPVRVAAGSLSLAIQSLAAETTAGGRISVTALSRLADEAVPETLREDAYRIVQAALTRAARDASCATVQIDLGLAGGELRILVEGDGRALVPADRGEECDLMRSIMHRVHRLRGTLAVERLANGGGRLGVRLPCAAQQAGPATN
jgi:PAS domain S-box-containing protein